MSKQQINRLREVIITDNALKKQALSEQQKEADSNVTKRIKYIRRFSLFPHKNSFTINCAHITNSLVKEIFEHKRFGFDKKKMSLEDVFDFRKQNEINKMLKDKDLT